MDWIHVTKEPLGRVRDILIHALEHITREWAQSGGWDTYNASFKILTMAWRRVNSDEEFCDELTLF
jgi:hypothetical protein